MIFSKVPEISGSMNNAMYIRSNEKTSDGGETNTWKKIFGDEARKVNPLFDVNTKRNDLIQNSIETDDWSKYNEFQAKQHPAWYEAVDGKQVPNKIYYGNLIESKIQALKEAKASNDQENVARWEKNLQEAIVDFNNAPGIVPYVVGLNHTAGIAAENGVAEPGDDYFDSKYNSAMVLDQGKFEANMWYDNAIFKEDEALKEHVEGLVAGTFPTSSISKPEHNVESPEKVAALDEQPLSASSILNGLSEENEVSSFDVQSAFLQNFKNIQQSIKPNLQEAFDKYKYA